MASLFDHNENNDWENSDWENSHRVEIMRKFGWCILIESVDF